MEIELRLVGNSTLLALEICADGKNHWKRLFTVESIVDKYRIKAQSSVIWMDKKDENVGDTPLLLATSENGKNRLYSKKYSESMFRSPWRHLFYQTENDVYTLKHIPSGTRGELIPVVKNNQPIAIFATSTVATAGKRKFSLFIDEQEEVENVLILYLIELMTSSERLDLDLLTIKSTFFYSFSGRKFLTKEHVAMMPVDRVPRKLEGISWIVLAGLLIALVSVVSLNYVLLSVLLFLGYQSYIIVRNLLNHSRQI